MDKYTKYVPGEKYDIAKGKLGVVWLGQAGFLFVTSDGTRIMLDPYASDSCERIIGEEYTRLSAFPLDADKLEADALLITHHHEDHYDTDYVPALAKKCPDMKIYASISAAALCEKDGIDMSKVEKIARGQSFEIGKIKARGVYADHGAMAPDALGFVLDIDGFTVYITGDTGYTMDKIKEAVPETPDLLVCPINGAYGNLNSEQAANFAIDMDAKNVVPCHYWTFREHEGDPKAFAKIAAEKGIADKVTFLSPGKIRVF